MSDNEILVGPRETQKEALEALFSRILERLDDADDCIRWIVSPEAERNSRGWRAYARFVIDGRREEDV